MAEQARMIWRDWIGRAMFWCFISDIWSQMQNLGGIEEWSEKNYRITKNKNA